MGLSGSGRDLKASPSVPAPRKLPHWGDWENDAGTENPASSQYGCPTSSDGEIGSGLRGECNAVKAIMKSLLKQDFYLCGATADCRREASD